MAKDVLSFAPQPCGAFFVAKVLAYETAVNMES